VELYPRVACASTRRPSLTDPSLPPPPHHPCSGLTRAGTPVRNADECAAACCHLGKQQCWLWQYNSTFGCWVGDSIKFGSAEGWVGGSRGAHPPPPSPPPSPPGPPTPFLPVNPPAAARDFDDAAWVKVDLPHDYIVHGTYDSTVSSHTHTNTHRHTHTHAHTHSLSLTITLTRARTHTHTHITTNTNTNTNTANRFPVIRAPTRHLVVQGSRIFLATLRTIGSTSLCR
jgi:hypothetical protein